MRLTRLVSVAAAGLSACGGHELESGAAHTGSEGAEASSATDASSSDSEPSTTSGASAGADMACLCADYHVDTYAPGLTKVGVPLSGGPSEAGAAGSLTFILAGDEVGDAAGVPFEYFSNVFTLRLKDSTGQPVTAATVSLPTNDLALDWPYARDPWMPCHEHGSTTTPTVTNNGDGTYAITLFFTPGPALWWIYIVAQTSSVTESVLYSFCVE
jgi:hypothetical protein